MATANNDGNILDKLDAVAAPLAQFDAFPKYSKRDKTRSESRGFLTILVGVLALFLLLNDISEYVWGWQDHEFGVDADRNNMIWINLDMVIAMPCDSLSVDLRDALGDRLMLSTNWRHRGDKGFLSVHKNPAKFELKQAIEMKTNQEFKMMNANKAVAQSRKSRGFFDFFKKEIKPSPHKPLALQYDSDPNGCRIYGYMEVRKVTANLHVTTAGHGYSNGGEHTDHSKMNLTHVINELSFGPYFPDITQPLDYSAQITQNHFMAYQYYLHIVPTTFIDSHKVTLKTNQYSVTHYQRELEHGKGTPGIFFKFDFDPMAMRIYQRTTTFLQLFIRCIGVLGGVFVCMGYAIRVTTRAVEVVAGPDESDTIAVTASGTSSKAGLRSKWAGGSLRNRNKIIRQGSGWTVDNSPGSPAMSSYSGYTGSYAGSPYPNQQTFSPAPSPYINSPGFASQMGSAPNSPAPGSSTFPTSPAPGSSAFPTSPAPGSAFMPPPPSSSGYRMSSPSLAPPPSSGLSSHFGPPSAPGTPMHGHFPPTPNPANGESGFPVGPPPRRTPSGGKKDD